MTVSFYLKRPDSLKPTIIYARIYYGSYEAKWYTNKSILPAYWNPKTKRARETIKFRQYPEFNTRLDRIADKIAAVIDDYANKHDHTEPKPEQLKPLLDAAIRKIGIEEKMTFHKFFKDFIARCENGIRLNTQNGAKNGKPIGKGTVKTYTTTLNCIEKFQEHTNRVIDFDNIDLQFYEDFIKYLTHTKNQSTNYIGKHIKVIKTVLKDPAALKYSNNDNLKLLPSFKTIREDSENIYLPEHELRQLAKHDLKDNPRLDRVRDLFLVGCYTGLRFSDLAGLTSDKIEDGYIALTQIKTGDPVTIPVHNMVKDILTKYGGQLPQAPSNQKMNDYIKEVARKVKVFEKLISISYTKGGERKTDISAKAELITTHTARRSFATNEYLAGTPAITIMAVTGHKTESAFMKYIKANSKEHAEIMKSSWDKRALSNAIAI